MTVRFNRLRRQLLLAGLAAPTVAGAGPAPRLSFPRDFGAHKDFGIEWWYITGRLRAGGRTFGFQITFFRSRVPATQAMRSRFAAKQLIFAHAALTDVQGRKHWHEQRVARSSGQADLDLAAVSEADTDIRLHNWSLQRVSGAYVARVGGPDFELDLRFTETQARLLQGDQGLSRKGPDPEQYSYYYSLPQLAVTGELTLAGQRLRLDAGQAQSAWLDHEWSQALLSPQAVGWDWIGMNLLDGSALTAFQLRKRDGQALWGGGSFRSSTPGASTTVFEPADIRFQPLRHWTSPLTQAVYPVEWQVQLRGPGGGAAAPYRVKAVLDNQELDSRASTGTLYWEGLSELFDAQGTLCGHGYLEMTGYAGPLQLR